MRSGERYERFAQVVDLPLGVLAVLWLPVLVIPLVTRLPAGAAESFDVVGHFVWAVFVVEYLVKFSSRPRGATSSPTMSSTWSSSPSRCSVRSVPSALQPPEPLCARPAGRHGDRCQTLRRSRPVPQASRQGTRHWKEPAPPAGMSTPSVSEEPAFAAPTPRRFLAIGCVVWLGEDRAIPVAQLARSWPAELRAARYVRGQ